MYQNYTDDIIIFGDYERMSETGKLVNSIKSSFLRKKEVKTEVLRRIAKPTLTYDCGSWTSHRRRSRYRR